MFLCSFENLYRLPTSSAQLFFVIYSHNYWEFAIKEWNGVLNTSWFWRNVYLVYGRRIVLEYMIPCYASHFSLVLWTFHAYRGKWSMCCYVNSQGLWCVMVDLFFSSYFKPRWKGKGAHLGYFVRGKNHIVNRRYLMK